MDEIYKKGCRWWCVDIELYFVFVILLSKLQV